MADGKRIEIDTDGMHEFSARLQGYVDKEIVPGRVNVLNELASHNSFGARTASPTVHDAAVKYWSQMEAAISYLDALTHNAAALARAAEEIVTTYRDADAGSQDFLRQVVTGASTELSAEELAAQRPDGNVHEIRGNR